MRELPSAVRVLGHPVVASVLTGGLVLGFLAFLTAGPNGIWPALILLIPAAWVARAAQAVKRERDWQRAWDSMVPSRAAAPTNWTAMAALGVLLAGAVWMVMA